MLEEPSQAYNAIRWVVGGVEYINALVIGLETIYTGLVELAGELRHDSFPSTVQMRILFRTQELNNARGICRSILLVI